MKTQSIQRTPPNTEITKDQSAQCRNGCAISREFNPKLVAVAGLKPLGRQTRKHPPAQLRKIAGSIERYGFVLPIVIDPQQRVIAGWAVVLTAKLMGLPEVPAVTISDLSDADLRRLRLELNRIAEDASWDPEALTLEFSEILEL